MRHRRTVVAGVLLAVLGIGIATDPDPASAGIPAGARLPDLAVLSPTDVRIVEWASGRRVLRFTSIVANVGRGPLQLSGYAKDGFAGHGDILNVRQLILGADGTFTRHRTDATMFWSGDGHNHWHVTDIQVASLRALDADMDDADSYRKTGFCFMDSYRYTSSEPAYYSAANGVCQTRASGQVRMGISVDWADIYPASIAYQWIDITNLPDGRYRLRVFADPATDALPAGNFLESDEANNVGWTKIRITGNQVTVLARSPRP